MNRKSCPFCGFINFSTDNVCKKCKKNLNENSYQTREIKFGIPVFEINGCGVNLVDYEETQTGSFEVMKWIVLLGVPVLPLSAWIIQPKDFKNELPPFYQKYSFNIIDKTPLKPNRVFRILLLNVISVTPIISTFFVSDFLASVFLNSDWRAETFLFLLIVSIVWMLGIQYKFSDNGHNKYAIQPTK